MINLSAVDLRVIVAGVDVSEAVDRRAPLWVRRDPVQFESYPQVTGQLSLVGGILAQSIDPRVNRALWRPGNEVDIQMATPGQSWAPLPFGGRLVIKDRDYESGLGELGDAAQPERLILFLVDSLGYAEQPESVLSVGGQLGQQTGIGQVLPTLTYGIGYDPQPADPTPTRDFQLEFAVQPQGESAAAYAHRLLWASPDTDDQVYGVWVDSEGRLRPFAADLAPAEAWAAFAEAELVALFPVREEREQLPGRVAARGLGYWVRPIPQPPTRWSEVRDEAGRIIRRDIYQNFPAVFNFPARFVTTTYEQEKTIYKDPELSSALKFSERVTQSTFYDPGGRVERVRTTSEQPKDVIDPDVDSSLPTVAQVSETAYEFGRRGVVEKRRTLQQKAWGLIREANPPEDASPLDLATEKAEVEQWQRITDDYYHYIRHVFHETLGDLYRGEELESGGAGGQPPRVDRRPPSFEVEQYELLEIYDLSYAGGQPGRTRRLDFGNLVQDNYSLKRLAAVEARLINGRFEACQLQFGLSQIPAEWPPGRVVFVESEVYLLSGEVVIFERDRTICGATGLWLGSRDGEDFTSAVQVIAQALKDAEGALITDEFGGGINA
ncbi:hypothetical protein GS597_09240 [Synechococcales cyanobacterium C]|uniref:Uncharacterized protein n=1 Tax=Petrachloros mirabilis ULC683 TaxID=2781853 RepID=A0A8K1ZYW7_9CYAN|nr:hypothetical protein [Petrachloros mirabilis]NCJ06687.1 hypothetical protein [Petrachloros mirabilis ULC683]